MVFFKAYIQSVLLGFKNVYTCPLCSKPGLDEIEYEADNCVAKSVKCDTCTMLYHRSCTGIKDTVDSVFICDFC